MECPATPSRDVLSRSRLNFEKDFSVSVLQQERRHAASKKPRRTKFVLETDSKIQGISQLVYGIRKRVLGIQMDFKSMEAKINRLGVIRERFFMSPKRVLSSVEGMMCRRSPMKLTYYIPDCSTSSDQGYSSPTQDKLVEFVRRRKLVSIHLAKVFNRLNNEKEMLDEIFQNNMNILRFKRAEKSLIKIIRLQSRLKILSKEFEGLEERLFSDHSFDEDSSYNLISVVGN